jgi:hypothetical protein
MAMEFSMFRYPPRCPIGLLQQPIHRLHMGNDPGMQHFCHHTIPVGRQMPSYRC